MPKPVLWEHLRSSGTGKRGWDRQGRQTGFANKKTAAVEYTTLNKSDDLFRILPRLDGPTDCFQSLYLTNSCTLG